MRRNCVIKMFSVSIKLINNGRKLVLEQIITTLATVADTAEEKFLDYYDRFMPTLKYVMENAVPKDLRLLRGKTIECISLIGLAVGHDKVGSIKNAVILVLILYRINCKLETSVHILGCTTKYFIA